MQVVFSVGYDEQFCIVEIQHEHRLAAELSVVRRDAGTISRSGNLFGNRHTRRDLPGCQFRQPVRLLRSASGAQKGERGHYTTRDEGYGRNMTANRFGDQRSIEKLQPDTSELFRYQ